MTIKIKKLDIRNRSDLNTFIKFPFKLYKGCSQWVPPLIANMRSSFNPEKHPFFLHSTLDLFIAVRDGQTVGRIAAMQNNNFNTHYDTKTAFFGFFDCVDDLEVSRVLFDSVFEWAQARGLEEITGPRGLIGADGAGVLVEGFEHRSALNIPYNFDYYDRLVKDSGFKKQRDSFSGYADVKKQNLPERIGRIAERVKKKRGFWIKEFANKDEMRKMVPEIAKVHQAAFMQGHGFYPHTLEEIQWIANDLISISDPSLIKLVMKEEEVIGFLFAYQDVSAALQKANGKLFPLGLFYILMERKRSKWVNVNGIGIIPEYQGLGANAVLYYELAKVIKSDKFNFEHADTVLIGEENYRSFSDNAIIGVTWYKKHRVYHRKF